MKTQTKARSAAKKVVTAARKTAKAAGRAAASKADQIRNLLSKGKTNTEIRAALLKKGFESVYYSEIQSAGKAL